LAVSAHCAEPEIAVQYAAWVGSRATQMGMYTISGGQPGHRAAWENPELNLLCNNFFADTLSTHDEAYLRPRYPGYIPFQEHAGALIRDFLRDGGDPVSVLQEINGAYRASLGHV
jgi:multiple sugar transport system substrate-binding protein